MSVIKCDWSLEHGSSHTSLIILTTLPHEKHCISKITYNYLWGIRDRKSSRNITCILKNTKYAELHVWLGFPFQNPVTTNYVPNKLEQQVLYMFSVYRQQKCKYVSVKALLQCFMRKFHRLMREVKHWWMHTHPHQGIIINNYIDYLIKFFYKIKKLNLCGL